MASRPAGFGLTAEVNEKVRGKYDLDQEQQAMDWMAAVIGEPISGYQSRGGWDAVHEALKDGVYLCRLISELTGSPVKFNTSKMAFKQMENIGKFLSEAEKYGVAKGDMFQTVDLYESQNMTQVVLAIHALGRKAQSKGYRGPTLGPKESMKNERDFSEEQLKAGRNVIGLQMGSNKGANQSGQNFGKSRSILD